MKPVMQEELWSTAEWRKHPDVKVGDIIEIAFGNKSVRAEVLVVTDTSRKEEAKEMFRYL